MRFSIAVALAILLCLGTRDANSAIPRGGDSWDLVKLRSGDIVATTMDSVTLRGVLEAAASTNAHILVRFAKSPSAQDRDELYSSGITLLSYVPYSAWTVRVDSIPPIGAISTLGIEWAGFLSPANKLELAIQNEDYSDWAVGEFGELLALVWFHEDISEAEASAVLDASVVAEYTRVLGVNAFAVKLDAAFNFVELASADEIVWIEQVPPPLENCMAEARPTVRANEMHLPPYSLTGVGVDVLVLESNHNVTDQHLDLQGRVYQADPGFGVTCCDPDHAHASIVGGIVAGNGSEDPAYSGMAPAAYVLSYVTEGLDFNDISSAFCEAVEGLPGQGGAHAADIANMSIGTGAATGVYTVYAQLADLASLGQNPECPNSIRLPQVWAAGNNGATWGSLSGSATGKNSLVVSAVDENNNIASFSSIGPTVDGRIKPEVCAPGTAITSCDCQTDYCTSQGTSFACPIVTGGLVLVMERLREVWNLEPPRPALLRAIVAASARDLGLEGPDFIYGFGLLDIASAINCVDSGEFGSGDITDFELTGEEDTETVYVSDESTPIVAVVAWDELPAAVLANPTLINDIDAWLVSPSGQRIDPYFADGDSPHRPASRMPDRVNNIEQIVVENSEPGIWTLHVRGAAVNEENDDNMGDGTISQSYQYAIYRRTATQYVNRSNNTEWGHGLDYSGTPYSAVSWRFKGEGDTDEIGDLFISMSDAPSVTYDGTEVSSQGIPQYEALDITDYVDGLPPSGLRGVAVGALDDDRIPELFAAHPTTPKLYHWNADNNGGRMEDWSTSAGLDMLATESTAGAWGDFDGDGYLDLFVCRATGYVEDPPEMEETRISPASRLLKNVLVAPDVRGFQGAGTGTGLADDLSSVCAAWSDVDVNGHRYLFVGTFGNPGSQLYRSLGDGTFETITSDLGQSWVRSRVTGCVWTYLNNDDYPDLVVSHFFPSTGENKQIDIFYGTASGVFDNGQGASPPHRIGSYEGYSGVAVYDYNLDTLQDILALSDDDNRGPDLLENRTAPQGAPAFVNVAAAVGLIDADGVGVGYTHGVVVADIGDGADNPSSQLDGIPDLYFGRPVSTGSFLYLANQNSSTNRHFVKVLLASSSASDNWRGIGARVTVDAGGQLQRQIVDGGSMRGGQAGCELNFGLGAYNGAVTATVHWPSGLVQPDVPLLLDQLNIIESGPVSVDDSSVSATYQAHPGGAADWYFSWETNTVGDPAYDCVIFNMSGIPPQCQPTHSAISSTTEDVTLSVTAMAGGGYRHQLIWENPPCVPSCNLGFWASSGSSAQADTSDVLAVLKVKICTN